MTLDVAVLRSWQTDPLRQASTDLEETSQLLLRQRDTVAVAVEQLLWQSTAAEQARAAGEELWSALGALAESYAMQGEVVARARSALELAQGLLSEADRVAAAYFLHVLADGTVTDPPPVMYAADAAPQVLQGIADAQAAAAQAQARAQAMAQEALASARECDRDAAKALRAADGIGVLLARLRPGLGAVLDLSLPLVALAAAYRESLLGAVEERPLPEPGTDPAQVSAWWASLPTAVRSALLATDPGRLGSLDGLPAKVRDEANRAALGGERTALLAEVKRLERALDGNWFGGTFTNDDAALEHAQGKLEALDVIEATIARPSRYLLVLDLSGEQAMAAVAIGDVDTAEHVAVFTPGMDTTVQGSLESYDRSLQALQRQAQNQSATAGGGAVATVSWLGYQAPQGGDWWRPSRSVANDEAASRGAERLSAFLNGLDAARPEPAHLTALAHSYGSLTTGLALQRGTGVDDAVFFGSPGLGTSEVTDLGLRPGHAYVIEARNDPVADLAYFGIDPNQLGGITGLAAQERDVDGVRLSESTGHSQYLVEGSTSQYAMAAVVAGLGDQAPRDDGKGFGDWLATPLPEFLR